MKLSINKTYTGSPTRMGHGPTISRILPNNKVEHIGPFIFLDHIGPFTSEPNPNAKIGGIGAHPHKGIITFSYLMSGQIEHYDSRGNHGIVSAGGVQWMNSGNGIVHDEMPPIEFKKSGGTMHALQLWINLPAVIKKQNPEYVAFQSKDIPEETLADNAGTLRILMGAYQGKQSPIKTYSPLLNYHVKLKASKSVSFSSIANFEYGVYVPAKTIQYGDKALHEGEFISFNNDGDTLTFTNNNSEEADFLLYGGEPLNEPVVYGGSFVMNSQQEIDTAYSEYHSGKYGSIQY
jgi:redox-sensitive bicupin YhaK (pirin superfamily)